MRAEICPHQAVLPCGRPVPGRPPAQGVRSLPATQRAAPEPALTLLAAEPGHLRQKQGPQYFSTHHSLSVLHGELKLPDPRFSRVQSVPPQDRPSDSSLPPSVPTPKWKPCVRPCRPPCSSGGAASPARCLWSSTRRPTSSGCLWRSRWPTSSGSSQPTSPQRPSGRQVGFSRGTVGHSDVTTPVLGGLASP